METRFNSVYEFEQYRIGTKLTIPQGSNSFYWVKPGGRFNLHSVREDGGFQRFDGYIEDGVVSLGPEFTVAGVIYDDTRPYNNLAVKDGATMEMDESELTISSGKLTCAGKIEMIGGSKITITNGGSMNVSHSAQWIISDESEIDIDDGMIYVYGKVMVPLTKARTLLQHPKIVWDSSTEIDVVGLDIEQRPTALRKAVQLGFQMGFSIYSSQIINAGNSLIKVTCNRMDYDTSYREVTVSVEGGIIDLGDFRLSIQGESKQPVLDGQRVRHLIVNEYSMMHVASSRNGHGYILPELYIGVDVNDTKVPGKCTVNGALFINGDGKLTLDRGGNIEINGTVCVDNGGKLIAAYAGDDPVLTVNGLLILDNMESLQGFNRNNIQVGPNGKICILNRYSDENHVLYSIPNGFESSSLNQILGHVLDRVQYCIQPNTGIEIDTFYDYYARDLRSWFGSRRIEDAVHTKHVVWHDGAFIKLNKSITWWADENCGLTDLVNIFKMSTAVDPEARLNDVANTLAYAGFGDVRFLIDTGGETRELTLGLKYPSIESVDGPASDMSYTVRTDSDGIGVLSRDMNTSSLEKGRTFDITDGEGKFTV